MNVLEVENGIVKGNVVFGIKSIFFEDFDMIGDCGDLLFISGGLEMCFGLVLVVN